MKERDRGYTIDEVEMLEGGGVKEAIVKTSILRITVEERDAARAEVEQWEKAASVLPGMDNPRSPQDLMDVSAKLRDLEAEVERLKSVQQAAFNDAHRAEADNARLREALREVGHWIEEEQAHCWCSIPSMIPYRGHVIRCANARAALGKEKS